MKKLQWKAGSCIICMNTKKRIWACNDSSAHGCQPHKESRVGSWWAVCGFEILCLPVEICHTSIWNSAAGIQWRCSSTIAQFWWFKQEGHLSFTRQWARQPTQWIRAWLPQLLLLFRKIAEQQCMYMLHISHSSVVTFMHKHLNTRRVCARYVPQLLM